ncbi:hypothetical protein OQA88_3489 [Cercophora sp. LCS_1]
MACPNCFSGTLRGDVIPNGREEVIHELNTYVTGPGEGVEPVGIVVIIADAFGWKLRNTRALADTYARRVPCTVYVPDVTNGHYPPESFMIRVEYEAPETDFIPVRLFKKASRFLLAMPALASFLWHNRQAVTSPRVEAFLRAARSSENPSAPGLGVPPKLGVAGFCWGGVYAVRATQDTAGNRVSIGGTDYPLVDCAFTAHPLWVKIPADIEAAVQPLSVANGDNDETMGEKGMKQLCAIIEAKNAAAGTEVHEAVVYPAATHGFAVRGDRKDPLQKERGDKSEDQAVSWFRRHLALLVMPKCSTASAITKADCALAGVPVPGCARFDNPPDDEWPRNCPSIIIGDCREPSSVSKVCVNFRGLDISFKFAPFPGYITKSTEVTWRLTPYGELEPDLHTWGTIDCEPAGNRGAFVCKLPFSEILGLSPSTPLVNLLGGICPRGAGRGFGFDFVFSGQAKPRGSPPGPVWTSGNNMSAPDETLMATAGSGIMTRHTSKCNFDARPAGHLGHVRLKPAVSEQHSVAWGLVKAQRFLSRSTLNRGKRATAWDGT